MTLVRLDFIFNRLLISEYKVVFMAKYFYLETFGCQMNVVDSERIADMLTHIGYQQTDDSKQADLVLLNTCSVRDKAERRVYGHLGRFKSLKKKNPELIVGVGGCVAQQEAERLLENIPHLDIVFGTHNVHKLPEMVQLVGVAELAEAGAVSGDRVS